VKISFFLLLIFLLSSCVEDQVNKKEYKIYNLIEQGSGIYKITNKDVKPSEVKNNPHEEILYINDKIIRIERKNKYGNLTDDFSVPAITKFEYNSDDQVSEIAYFNKDHIRATHNLFRYHKIEYIYDDLNRVTIEIYKDVNSKFLDVPRDSLGNISKENFISPVLTYEYLEDQIRIKAFDKNFALLKEIIGDKPCIPFIDCGENE
jgi:uncharacterized protein YkuJ